MSGYLYVMTSSSSIRFFPNNVALCASKIAVDHDLKFLKFFFLRMNVVSEMRRLFSFVRRENNDGDDVSGAGINCTCGWLNEYKELKERKVGYV